MIRRRDPPSGHRSSGIRDVSSVVYPAYPDASGSMRSQVCGIEIVNGDGEVLTEILDAVATRIHRGTMQASAEDRSRVDAAYVSENRLSPWMEELARRTLGVASAESALSTDTGEETEARELGQLTLAAVNTRLIDRELRLRGVRP